MDALFNKFCSKRNLELAWARLKTAQNIYYKNYYRDLFLGYELARKKNIQNLHERLRGGSYKPYKICKIFIPKSSGLHRPIIFLSLDDQIVYQAMCNVIADRHVKQRSEVEYKNVFSNLFSKDINKSIFMLKKWQEGYSKYLHKIKEYYESGYEYVAYFDLAAYYDTICHSVFKNLISRCSYNDFCEFFLRCLCAWTSDVQPGLTQGIPQGPMASSIIGELYMMPVDRKLLKNEIKYVRYVDDIKIFGKSEKEVLAGVIILDRECKERGLIPQSKKYEIIHAESAEEAIGKNPSIPYQIKNSLNTDKEFIAKEIETAFKEDSVNISKIRYILKASEKNDKVLNTVFEHLTSHFYLIDEFCIFLLNYCDSSRVAQKIYQKTIHKPSPYEYIEGKCWELLSKYDLTQSQLDEWGKLAIKRLKKARNKPSLRIGLYKFIARSDNIQLLRWLPKEEYAFIQMVLSSHIDCRYYDNGLYWNLMDRFLLRHTYDPCMGTIKELVYNMRQDCLAKIPPPTRDDSNVIANTIGMHQKIDTIGQILRNRYSIVYSSYWKTLFMGEYDHANRIIHLADKAFYIDKNSWVSYTDSFNDILIRCLINTLKVKQSAITWPNLTYISGRRAGQKMDFGQLLDSSNELSRRYPNIVDGIRKYHIRRRTVPTSHAYESRTGDKTKYITGGEQKNLSNHLFDSYCSLINVLPTL
jgi:hypothetical protein